MDEALFPFVGVDAGFLVDEGALTGFEVFDPAATVTAGFVGVFNAVAEGARVTPTDLTTPLAELEQVEFATAPPTELFFGADCDLTAGAVVEAAGATRVADDVLLTTDELLVLDGGMAFLLALTDRGATPIGLPVMVEDRDPGEIRVGVMGVLVADGVRSARC